MSTVIRGYNWDDAAVINFNGTPQTYHIGTMTVASDPAILKIYPTLAINPDNNKTGFTSHRLLLYATETCVVRFNGPARAPHTLLPGDYYEFFTKIHTIYISKLAGGDDGILYLHAEG